MSSKLHHSAGHKNFQIAIGDTVHKVTIRRLPLRPMDNDSRYRVRLTTATLDGRIITDSHRDMDISKAYRVFEQNKARLADMVA
ncbi:hypothetical protein ABZ192_12660 [Streptomyces sp. NPDC006235]|uniref:hypothetical protein n=1 Tax=Streptomyces sp. NPDC006235 TaxID=3156736 RepID=UPI0033BE88B3